MLYSRLLPREGKLIPLAVVFCATLFLLQTAQSPCVLAQTTNTTEDLTRQATLVFKGTVEKTGASTMPAVKANVSTAVVRVDQVIDGPGAPPDLVGKQITVQLLDQRSVKAGTQAVFFTKGWLLGNSMAVIEVGRVAATVDVQRVSEQIKNTRRKMADEKLQDALATTETVIVGRVINVRPSDIPHIGSEHDPDWYQANILVESVLKGQLPGREVTLLFPHSDDVMWHDSPKFTEGEQGIWLLHRNQARLPGIENRYTVLNPLDFRSREELNRVQQLLKAVQ